jgi:hypothetical protein
VGSTLESITEREIIVKNVAEQLEQHSFDFENQNFFNALRKISLDIYAKSDTVTPIDFIAPGYTFDLYINENQLLADERVTFDLDVPFDSNTHFDSDVLDPTFNYLGMSLIDRNERAFLYSNTLAYDSTVFPIYGSILSPLVYTKGYYVKTVDMESDEASLTLIETMSGTFSDGTMVDEDDGFFVPLNSGTANLDDGLFIGGPSDNYDDGTF